MGETRDADVCVIGAGLAGLTAARRLVAAGVDVSLLLGALVAALIYLPLRGRTKQRA